MGSALALKPHLMNAEEFSEWTMRPEFENRSFELVRGEVIELPNPKKPHGVVCSNVSWILNNFVRQKRKGYVTTNDAGIILERDPDTVRGPDVALFEDDQDFDEIPQTYSENPPVLAVEVLSPDHRADQINRKITDYLKFGVKIVWVIDPSLKTLTVYRAKLGPRMIHSASSVTGEDVLPGLKCKVKDFFTMPGSTKKGLPKKSKKRKNTNKSS